jgi:hypothetical protein
MGNCGIGVNCSQSEVMFDNKPVLDDFIKKSLLQRIEKSNLRRSEVDLKQVCDQDKLTFGLEGDSLRRLIQISFWANVKRQSIRNYVARLKEYGIEIGFGTRQELQEQATAASPPTPSDSFEEEETAEDTTAEDTAEEETTAIEADHKEKDDILSPLQQTLRLQSLLQDLSLSSKEPSVTFESPPDSSARRTLDFETMSSSEKPSSGAILAGGSRGNPYVIPVDSKHPENNREFEVTVVPRIIHGGWSRPGIVIRKQIGIPDEPEWLASMYRKAPYDKKDRAILIQGLKRSSAYEDWETFNRRKDHCESLKEMMTNTSAALVSDKDRKICYFLLVFDEEIELDNVIISGDRNEIEKRSIGCKSTTDGISTATMFVYWRVAIVDGGHRIDQKVNTTAANAFAD